MSEVTHIKIIRTCISQLIPKQLILIGIWPYCPMLFLFLSVSLSLFKATNPTKYTAYTYNQMSLLLYIFIIRVSLLY